MRCGSVQELEMYKTMDRVQRLIRTDAELDRIARSILQRLKDGSKKAVPTSE